MKTLEELAEECVERLYDAPHQLAGDPEYCIKRRMNSCYLAGYQAAERSNSSNNLNGWISVKDRLPEIGENDCSNRVLLLTADKFIVIARVEKCVRFVRPLEQALIVETDNGDPIEEFTHWMPLPKLPEDK
jgi:hypothetical protein